MASVVRDVVVAGRAVVAWRAIAHVDAKLAVRTRVAGKGGKISLVKRVTEKH